MNGGRQPPTMPRQDQPGPDPLPHGAGMLTECIAAIVAQHGPGWRLPRLTALARRCNLGADQAGTAVDELVRRHLVRRLPDGQLYRSSPAEHLTSLEGITGPGTRVDPMGAELTCVSHQVSLCPAPAQIAQVLRIPPSEPVCVVLLEWASGGRPAATARTYLAAHTAGQYLPEGQRASCWPAAMTAELQPPPPPVATRLRLAPGQPAFLVTARFDEAGTARPSAVTATALHPKMFRIVLEPSQLSC